MFHGEALGWSQFSEADLKDSPHPPQFRPGILDKHIAFFFFLETQDNYLEDLV